MNRKPQTWAEWRRLFWRTSFDLGWLSQTYWRGGRPDLLRDLIRLSRRMDRIEARMNSCRDATWARAIHDMVFNGAQ